MENTHTKLHQRLDVLKNLVRVFWRVITRKPTYMLLLYTDERAVRGPSGMREKIVRGSSYAHTVNSADIFAVISTANGWLKSELQFIPEPLRSMMDDEPTEKHVVTCESDVLH